MSVEIEGDILEAKAEFHSDTLKAGMINICDSWG